MMNAKKKQCLTIKQYLTIRQAKVSDKKVLLRVDFNVPLDENGKITNDKRIVDAIPTITYLLERNAKIIIMSHLGRPQKADSSRRDLLTMSAPAKRLGELLKRPVKKLDDCIGEKVESAVNAMQSGEIIVLENLRFYEEEKANDKDFAKKLAKLGEIYCNDAFSNAHRAHASMVGVPLLLQSYAGFLLDKELDILSSVMKSPKRPFVAILGGVKLKTKIPLIKNFLKKTDKILIGGAMGFTFLRAKGMNVGSSLVDESLISVAKKMMSEYGEKLILPVDFAVDQSLVSGNVRKEVVQEEIPRKMKGFDIGKMSVDLFKTHLKSAGMILWNGPLGAFEIPPYNEATNKVAKFIATLSCEKIIGGGDTAAAIEACGVTNKMTHVSTGGGASLALFEGKELVAVSALNKQR